MNVPQNVDFAACFRLGARSFVLRALVVLSAIFIATILIPSRAWAVAYDVSCTDIEARINAAGTLVVTEQRDITFEEPAEALKVSLGSLSAGAVLLLENVSLSWANNTEANGSDPTELPEVPFQFPWREEGAPQQAAYSYDKAQNTLYLFFGEAPAAVAGKSVTLSLQYEIASFAQVYADVAEVRWEFVPSSWDAACENVNLSLTIPAPADSGVSEDSSATAILFTGNEPVSAWLHGAVEEFLAAEEGSGAYRIECEVQEVAPGQYAELRAVFPRAWLTELAANYSGCESAALGLPDILQEEIDRAQAVTWRRIQETSAWALSCALCLGLLLWALLVNRRIQRKRGMESQAAKGDSTHKGALLATLDSRALSYRRRFVALGLTLMVVAGLLAVLMKNLVPLALFGLTGLLLIVLGNSFPRHTPE